MKVHPYLDFDGRCEEALEFYRNAVGANVQSLMRFRDAPEADKPAPEGCGLPAGGEDKVMHACVQIGEATLFASDGRCTGKTNFAGISLSIEANDDDHAETLFSALREGGQVQMPLEQTFFASRFGMLVDRFGVTWMVISKPMAG